MTIAIYQSGVSIPEIPRGEIVPASDHMWLPLHGGSDTTVENTGNVLSDQTIAGTLGAFWSANAPYVTFNGSDHIITDTSTDAAAFYNWSTLGDGDLIIAFDWRWSDSSPTAQEMVFSYTMGGGAGESGFGLIVNATNYLSMQVRSEAGTIILGGMTAAVLPVDVDHHVVIHISGSNKTVHYYVDGVKDGDDGDWSIAADMSLIPAQGFIIGGRSRGAAANNLLNAGSSGTELGNFFVMRTAYDTSAVIATWAAKWYRRHELPWELDNA